MWLQKLHKEWKRKKRKTISFMVIPQFHGKLKSLTLSVKWIVIILSIFVVIASINIYVFCTYTIKINQVINLTHLNSKLQNENQLVKPALKEQNYNNQTLGEIKKQNEEILTLQKSINKKTNGKFNLPSRGFMLYRSRPDAISLKKSFSEKDQIINISVLRENAQLLRQEMLKQKEQMQMMIYNLKDLERQVDHTPSMWPAYGPITSRFSYWRLDPVNRNNYRPHTGIDIQMHIGTPVHATADGVVTAAGWCGGYGYRIEINHAYSFVTLYGHLSQLKVFAGQVIKKGQVIAYSGNTGHSSGPHLHYELRSAGRPINPYSYLSW